MIAKEKVCRSSFKKLKGLFLIHAFRQCNKKWILSGIINIVPTSHFANASFAKIFIFELHKHLVAILRYLFKVPKVYSNLVVVMFKFDVYKFHFRCLRATKIL
jgi:hypothetical protein